MAKINSALGPLGTAYLDTGGEKTRRIYAEHNPDRFSSTSHAASYPACANWASPDRASAASPWTTRSASSKARKAQRKRPRRWAGPLGGDPGNTYREHPLLLLSNVTQPPFRDPLKSFQPPPPVSLAQLYRRPQTMGTSTQATGSQVSQRSVRRWPCGSIIGCPVPARQRWTKIGFPLLTSSIA